MTQYKLLYGETYMAKVWDKKRLPSMIYIVARPIVRDYPRVRKVFPLDVEVYI